MKELQTILLSERPLWISRDGYLQLMVAAFQQDIHVKDKSVVHSSQLFGFDTKSYCEKSHDYLQNIVQAACLVHDSDGDEDDSQISITDDFASNEIPDNTIAYHHVFGVITSTSNYYFSSKQLERDVIAAENNPAISCHLLHINSPGGEAWYLDRLSETLNACKKPILTLYENNCCSAGYYIGCHGQKVYALTQQDYAGCIGTMCSFYDYAPYYKALGINQVEAKATNSDLKNKVFDDLRDGKPQNYVTNFLDPLNNQFLTEVRNKRSQISALDDSAPVLRGETYITSPAIEIGLCDDCKTLKEVLAEADIIGKQFTSSIKLQNSTYNFLNN